ncbi:MAG: rRNA maturation RNase YbeY [Myxococcales bacterium]|nr:rRNA maturation RNase YbeY [Myxococcales bacterium]
MVLLQLEPEDLASETGALRVDAQRMLEVLERGAQELSVVLCDDRFIRDLNDRFRGKAEPTDVLSFPQGDGDLLGDVVIDVEQAARQAEREGHDLAVEVRVLLAHGLLHLLGHRHDTDDALQTMAEAEAVLLDGVGIPQRGLVARSQ